MAITKVYARHYNLQEAIDYAINPDKTEQHLFESVINCSSVKNAYAEMCATKRKFGKEDKVLAFHYIQSFKPNELTPELAHKIGVEFAKECFGDRFEVVVGTHLDRAHLHNHIVVNSVSFVDGGKLRSNRDSYYNIIRKTSDRICAENGLSLIVNPQNRGMHYAEWKALNEGKPTIRGQIRTELDEIISQSKTMIQFFELLRKNGYQIRSGNRKYTSVKPPYSERYIRLKSLGADYTEDAINERIKAARNGIRLTPPSVLSPKYRFRGNFKSVPRKKLKGFMALYFHYLYLFKKIRRRQTPKKVSAFMRDELIKFERYKKQFRFICDHGIETDVQLNAYQSKNEDEINALTKEREALYNERNDADEQEKEDISQRIAEINGELKACRAAVRLCKSIFEDAQRIAEKYEHAQALSAQELEKEKKEKEMRKNEHKRRGR